MQLNVKRILCAKLKFCYGAKVELTFWDNTKLLGIYSREYQEHHYKTWTDKWFKLKSCYGEKVELTFWDNLKLLGIYSKE